MNTGNNILNTVSHKIAFVVPTMDRKEDICFMLKSIERQTVLPNQIIIVDGGYNPIPDIVNEFSKLNIDYIRVFPPSLARQKNEGVKIINDNITLVGFLDDDLELCPDAIEKMIAFWDNAPSTYGGAAFAITNSDRKVGAVRKLFGMDSNNLGEVLSTGFVSMLDNPRITTDVSWLYGGATVWKRKVLEEFKYDEWFKGSGYMEDIDFSFNIGGSYSLIILSEARVNHHHHPIRRDRYYILGEWQIINRLYFVRKYKHRGLSIFKAWLSSFILFILNMAASILKLDYDRFRLTLGNIAGIFLSIFKKNVQISGHLKSIK